MLQWASVKAEDKNKNTFGNATDSWQKMWSIKSSWPCQMKRVAVFADWQATLCLLCVIETENYFQLQIRSRLSINQKSALPFISSVCTNVCNAKQWHTGVTRSSFSTECSHKRAIKVLHWQRNVCRSNVTENWYVTNKGINRKTYE